MLRTKLPCLCVFSHMCGQMIRPRCPAVSLSCRSETPNSQQLHACTSTTTARGDDGATGIDPLAPAAPPIRGL
uniref:Uncharacterized protein n=1 Tax=Setaria italica TaxID=4555 RepID=K4AHL5_SETIT